LPSTSSGAHLGNRRNIAEAGEQGRKTQAEEADRFAAAIRPMIAAIKANGIVGGMGSIAEVLNARGVRTSRGARWHASTVRNLLTR
jgi:hypothetical protein